MKTSCMLSVFAALFADIASAATTITVDSIRQNWPWSAEVSVRFTLSGVTSVVDVSVEAFAGGRSLGAVAAVGDSTALSADGPYELRIDPTTITAVTGPLAEDFSVRLTPVAADPSWNVPLYRIYDLTREDADVEIVTPEKLVSGAYGDWMWTCETPAPGPGDPVPYTNLVWTGVTQDVYKTSKLVMRYIPGKGDTVMICTMKDSSYTMPDNYYVGVFETTQKQWENVMGSAPACTHTGEGGMRPVETVTYAAVRGHSSGNYWPQDPASGSFIAELRAKTSDAPFDLPVAYQLTYAAEAGSGFGTAGSSFAKSTWPDNTPTVEIKDGVTVTNAAPGRYNASSTSAVGRFAPSVQGIYDIVGNVGEMCVDWWFESQSAQRSLGALANVDPENPARSRTPSGSSENRTCTGSNYSEASTYRNSLNYARSAVTPTSGKATIGFRLFLPVEDDEEDAPAQTEVVSGVSAAIPVFVRPAETAFWRTATNATFEVSWTFPSGAAKADLSVVGMCTSRLYPNLAASSQVVMLPAASAASGEDVYELTLSFDDGTVKRATIGVVRGAAEGSTAIVDYANDAKRSWCCVGPRAVLPVPFGASSISVDGTATALDGASGWFGYVYPSSSATSSVSLTAGDEVCQRVLRPWMGVMLVVR